MLRGLSVLLFASALLSAEGACAYLQGKVFTGGDLQDVGVTASPDDCCGTCQTTPLCVGFSWMGGTNKHCMLKKQVSNASLQKGTVSGTLASGPTPAPGPTPPPVTRFDWLNSSLSVNDRVEALLAAMTTAEKASQLNTDAPAIPRLRLPKYGWWSEGAHGVAWAGKATVFPAAIALAATFDAVGVEAVGVAIGMEARAKYNDAFKKAGGTDSLFGLTLFAPNINLVRDVRWVSGL